MSGRLTASRWAAYEPDAPSLGLPPELVIRRARVGDCAQIAAIEASRDGVEVEPTQRRCEAQAADSNMLLLVAEVDGNVVGFGRAGWLRSPGDAAPDGIPEGWYLLGVIVIDAWRRHGIAHALTMRRLEWIRTRGDAVYYFVNARNRASRDLHFALGFVEVTTRFSAPGVEFEGGEGVLYRLDLQRAGQADTAG